jgi:catechol 2,3-dioxygenase-like lactoylglutathione lyase family enzyme
MAITLDHTIVPAHDKAASAAFFADLFGLRADGVVGHFVSVRVNETLTLDFDDRWKNFISNHYAFHLGDEEFDAIFARLKKAGISYGSTPWTMQDMKIDTSAGGRSLYFLDPNSHFMEIRTMPMSVELAQVLPDLRERAGLSQS